MKSRTPDHTSEVSSDRDFQSVVGDVEVFAGIFVKIIFQKFVGAGFVADMNEVGAFGAKVFADFNAVLD